MEFAFNLIASTLAGVKRESHLCLAKDLARCADRLIALSGPRCSILEGCRTLRNSCVNLHQISSPEH